MQNEAYPILEPDELPLSIAETSDGSPPVVSVDLAGRDVQLLVRMARVGRVPLLLLDSNLPENEPPDREITARLYGGGHETRLQQEIVLGIGGSRALEKVGVWPTIRHINEGHAAFVSLEKIRHLVQEEHLSFAEAREVATTGNIFTTHTPGPGRHRRVHARAALEVLRRLRRTSSASRSTSSSTSAGRSAISRASSSRWRCSRCGFRRIRTPSRACTPASRAGSGAASCPTCRSRRCRSVRSPTASTERRGPRRRSPRRAFSTSPEDVDRARVLACPRGAARPSGRRVPAEAGGREAAARRARGGDRRRLAGPRSAGADDRIRTPLRHVQARDAALPRAEASGVPAPPDRTARPDPLRRQGAPARRGRKGVPAHGVAGGRASRS